MRRSNSNYQQSAGCLNLLPVILTLSMAVHSDAVDRNIAPGYRILSTLHTPYELLDKCLPSRSTAPVTLSGSVADEIKASLKTLKIDNPQFIESYDRQSRFRLELSGNDIDDRTREMVSGILNPAAMTEAVFGSVLRYGSPDKLAAMQNETEAQLSFTSSGDTVFAKASLLPKGSRFSYEWNDIGIGTTENWLTSLSVTADTARHLAREIVCMKAEKTSRSDSLSSSRTSLYRYLIGYTAIGQYILPSNLELSIDYKPVLSINSSYRTENGYVVLDKRVISCFLKDGSAAQLSASYGSYSFKGENDRNSTTGNDYGKAVADASNYTRKAADAINKGDIAKAVQIYRSIVRNYPGTPQAVESAKLLDGIPKGF